MENAMVADDKVLEHAVRYGVFPSETCSLVAALLQTYYNGEYEIRSNYDASVCQIVSLARDGASPLCVFTIADRETIKEWFSVYADLGFAGSFLRAMDVWDKYGVDAVGRVGIYITDVNIGNTGYHQAAALFFKDVFYFENEADAVTFSMKYA